MNPTEIKAAIQTKKTEFEFAVVLNKPDSELKKIYYELKDLQYQLAKAELAKMPPGERC